MEFLVDQIYIQTEKFLRLDNLLVLGNPHFPLAGCLIMAYLPPIQEYYGYIESIVITCFAECFSEFD
jgi:hypothetical protein